MDTVQHEEWMRCHLTTNSRIEIGEEANPDEINVTASKPSAISDDREKILELIADIGNESETMMANYKEYQVIR